MAVCKPVFATLTSCALVAVATLASADPIRLRMSTPAPDGTAYARELRALSRDIEGRTGGTVGLKWYFGSIAGDEEAVLARIDKGQLDGFGGAAACMKLAPSLRVMRLPGLILSWDEAKAVLARLRTTLDDEFRRSGFVSLGEGGFGNDIAFSRLPIGSLGDLRRSRFAIWDRDLIAIGAFRELGLKTVALPLEEIGRAYAEGHADGMIVMPGPALAFQWTSRARYFTALPLAFFPGCLVISSRTFNALPVSFQQELRAAGAKFQARFDDLGRSQDQLLLGGLFEHQGMKRVPVTAIFRSEFLAAARHAREQVSDKLVPSALLSQVASWLSDYRAEHPVIPER